MSYLSQLKNHQISAKQFLAQSVRYLTSKTGVAIPAAAVDAVVAAEDLLTDQIEAAVRVYLEATLPHLPAEIATSAATAVLSHIDAAIAGAGAIIKANSAPSS